MRGLIDDDRTPSYIGPVSDTEMEMARLLGLIDAEWQSDPKSVACFDLRIVEQVREILRQHKERAAYTRGILKKYSRGLKR